MQSNQAVIEQETRRLAEYALEEKKIAGEQPLQDAAQPQQIFYQVGRQGDVVVVQFSRLVEHLGMTLPVAREMLNRLRDVVNGIEPVRMRHKRK